jgi:4-hydroxybenzoate polyprenyltransferase
MLLIMRPLNLFIVALTMGAVRCCAIAPHTPFFRLDLFDFAVLVFSTMAVTAGGNVVNDCYDHALDRLNKPEKTFIPDRISLAGAWRLYAFLVVTGFAAAAYLAGKYDHWPSLAVYPLAVGLLWFYSAYAQKRPLLGNLIVAAFCAAVVYLPLWGEMAAWTKGPHWVILHLYAGFAFWSTLARELVKDMEDVKGDASAGYRTLPIAFGPKVAFKFVTVILAVLLAGLLTAFGWSLRDFGFSSEKTVWFLIGALAAAGLLVLWLSRPAHEKRSLGRFSTALKGFIGLGILWLLAGGNG